MKRLFRLALCTGLIAALLSIPAFAAEGDAPEVQGDFSVLVNGEYLTFADAAPELRDNRSCLPFVAVFDALGFAEEDMTWDAATKTVTAVKPDVTYDPLVGTEPQVGDLTVELTVGSPQISYWYEYDLNSDEQGAPVQVVHTYETDVAPYIANNRTYIPFGLVADALGYQVGWDSQTRAVIIDDVDAILAANTETYEWMDKYLSYQQSLTEGYREFDATSTFDLQYFVGTTDNYIDADLEGTADYWRLMSGHDFYESDLYILCDGGTGMHGSDILNSIYDRYEYSPIPDDFHSHTIRDVENGIFYTSFPDIIIGPDWPDGYFEEHYKELEPLITKPWYQLDLDTAYDWMYGPDTCAQLAALAILSPDHNFADTLATSLQTADLTSVQRTTGDILAQYNAVFADSAFEKSGSSYVSQFSTDGTEGVFTLYTTGNEVTGYALDLTPGETDLTLSIRGEGETLTATLTASLEYPLAQGTDLFGYPLEQAGKLTLSIDLALEGSYRDATLDDFWTEPPADEPVIDLTDASDALTQVWRAALDRTPVPFPGTP